MKFKFNPTSGFNSSSFGCAFSIFPMLASRLNNLFLIHTSLLAARFLIILILFSCLLCFASSCRRAKSYSLRESQKYGEYVAIFANNELIAKIKPKYKKEVADISIFKEDATYVEPIYSVLVDRGDIPQPKAFDDITGDGKSNIICTEQQTGFVNHGPYPNAVRIFTIDGNQIIEHKPIITTIGEAIHFDDFNKDGILELVNTDNEREFKYLANGLPDSPLVWYWDKQERQYKPCGKEKKYLTTENDGDL